MKSKNLISNQYLPGKEKRMLTTINIAELLSDMLASHIGRKNAISKEKLFSKIFKKTYSDDDIKDWLRWEFVKKALHLLRQRTNCFPISERKKNGQYIFYVCSTYREVDIYKNKLNKSIKAMNKMKERAQQSVEEKWYKQKFELLGVNIRKKIKSK